LGEDGTSRETRFRRPRPACSGESRGRGDYRPLLIGIWKFLRLRFYATQVTLQIQVLRSRPTRSSAVAERPRDALCLSVVSFNSTILRAQSFIISYFGFRFTNGCNYILFCSVRCNVEASCHKDFVVRLPRTTNDDAYKQ